MDGAVLRRLLRMTHGRGQSMRELLARGDRSFSFEFFPPKDEAGEQQLWQAITDLEPYGPTFVSVTYGAGGTTRDRTVGDHRADRPGDQHAPGRAPDLRRAHDRARSPRSSTSSATRASST